MDNKSFTNQKSRIATEEECKAPWSGQKDGRNFRCKLCGHRFQVGDQWRFVFGKKAGNFKVCGECDTGDNEDLKNKVNKAWEESKERFWYLHNEIDAEHEDARRPIFASCPRCKEEFEV